MRPVSLIQIRATLGDNVRRSLSPWREYLLWNDRIRPIPVLEASGRPLIDARQMTGSQLTSIFRNGGEVLIEEL